MTADHSKEPKCCCTECGKELYTIYFEKHFRSCKHKDNLPAEQKVSCPICGKRVKEINTAHLRKHGVNVKEFKEMFPGYETLSRVSRENKRTLTNLTPEISKKLKYGHTLQAKIERYGEEGGLRRHKETLERYSHSKTMQGYIDRLGEEEGMKAWEERIKKISKASKAVWQNPSQRLKMRGTLEGYQNVFGLEEGYERWILACNRKSKSLRKLPEESRGDFCLYRHAVYRVTRASIKLSGNNCFKTRSKEIHLDHMYSILGGFLNLVDPYVIGMTENLRLVSRSENCSKQHRCIYTKEELFRLFLENKVYYDMASQDTLNLRVIYKDIYNKYHLFLPTLDLLTTT